MKEIINRFFDIIKSSLFVQFVLFVLGITILFGKQDFLKHFSLHNEAISDVWRTLIGLVTLLTGICIFTLALQKTISCIISWLKILCWKGKTVKEFSSLSEIEKLLFFHSVRLNMPLVIVKENNPIVLILLSRGLLAIGSLNTFNRAGIFKIPANYWEIIKNKQKTIFNKFTEISNEELLERFEKHYC